MFSPRPRRQPIPEEELAGAIPTIPAPRRSGFLQAFSSLQQRNFRLFWFGQMISLMGTWMQAVGQTWLVLQLTHSGWQLGVVGALQFLPILLFSLFGGVLVDRWPKRGILLVTQSAGMIQAFLLWGLIVTGMVQLWHIYVLAVLLGLTNSLDQPARSTFVVEIVGREDLRNAIVLNSSLLNLARIVGPGLGGIIIAASGVTALFLLNGCSYIAVLVGLALIRIHELHIQVPQHGSEMQRKNTWQSLREGISYARKTPALALLIPLVGLVLLLGANFDVVLPLFATEVLHVGATGFGFLSAAMSAGSLLAALWLAWSNRGPTIRLILIGLLVFGLLEGLFALSHLYLLSLALIASVGAAEAIAGQMTITAIQTVAPDHLRGRVTSISILFFTGSIPPGYLLAGWLSGRYGAPIALLICTFLLLLTVGIGWILREPAERSFAEAVL